MLSCRRRLPTSTRRSKASGEDKLERGGELQTCLPTYVVVASRVKTRPTRTQGQGLVGVGVDRAGEPGREATSRTPESKVLLDRPPTQSPPGFRWRAADSGRSVVAQTSHTTPELLGHTCGRETALHQGGGGGGGGVSDSPNQDKTIEISKRSYTTDFR